MRLLPPARHRNRTGQGAPSPAVSLASRLDIAGATSSGPRPDNQDRFAYGSTWAMVADGVGGNAGGGTAATLAVDAASAVLDGVAPDDLSTASGGALAPEAGQDLVRRAIAAAGDAVVAGQAAEPAKATMASTIVLASAVDVDSEGVLVQVAHLGDSPAWLAEGHATRQITNDHNLVSELVRAGALTPEEALAHQGRHVVTRALGAPPPHEPELVDVTIPPGGALILASDGLSDVLGPADLHQIAAGEPTAAGLAQRLVDAALDAGTHDNVTVAVLRHLPPSGNASERTARGAAR